MENVENHCARKNDKLIQFTELAAENKIQRLDGEFLRRFLVGHHDDIGEALKAVCNFESFIDRRRDRWLKLEKSRVKNILESHIVDVVDENGLQGQKLVWIRVEKWDPGIFTADEILEVSGLLCELVYVNTKEIKSIDVIIDLHKFSLRHLNGLSKKFAKRLVFFMSQCLPMEMLHVYIVRQPKIFYLAYSLFKPFIEERMRKLIHICGCNYDLLLENIGKEILPLEFDGSRKNIESNRWLNILYEGNTQKDLKISGYEFYEAKTVHV